MLMKSRQECKIPFFQIYFLSFTMFQRVLEAARKPGALSAVRGVAPTQRFSEKADCTDEEAFVMSSFLTQEKGRLLDRWLDKIVRASGSEFVFFGIMAALLVWALLGIPFGRTENWQVIISDVQAIFSYAFDSLLVRQQMNMYDREMMVAAEMQSRVRSHLRMLSKAGAGLTQDQNTALLALCNQDTAITNDHDKKLLPAEGRFGQSITLISHILGHIVVASLFWVAVFAWIGIGPMFNFSDSWQLYMNSASSAWMVLYFAFLANIRERHSTHDKKCLDSLFVVDSSLEARLRALTADQESNAEVVLSAPKVNKLQRAIFYYADFVGTLVGIGILLTVMITWLATGPVFRFSSNWWLFIGTYAGLIGMHDGFVLRNMQARLTSYVEHEMDVLHQVDKQIFERTGLPFLESTTERHLTISERVSILVDKVSSHEITVLMGVLTIIGLLVGASAQKWTLTGQLLCNVPPSIIESFLMMILVTGHNLNDDRKRLELQALYERRVRLLRYAQHIRQFQVQPMVAPESKEFSATVRLFETAA